MAAKDYGAVIDAEQGGKWWEKRYPGVTKEQRMAMNGETEAQMAWAEAVSRNREGGVSLNEEDGNDTSQDQDWIIPKVDVFTYSWEEHQKESLFDRMERQGLILTRDSRKKFGISPDEHITVKELPPGVVIYSKDKKETRPRKLSIYSSKEDGSEIKREGWFEFSEEDFPVTVAKEEYSGADLYVLATTVSWMLPKLVLFFPVMFLLSIVPMLIAHIYIATLPEPIDRVPRTCGFYFWFSVAFIMAIPAILVIILNLLLDSIMYYLFSLPFCLFTWNWAAAFKGMERIRPFKGGPSILLKMPDIFVCVMGQSMRQGTIEVIYMVSMMWVLIPWLKYYVNCNPWIYELDYRMVQQISTGMQDLGEKESSDVLAVDEVADECRRIISRARHTRERAKRIDLWSFVPHYPYPPADRRWAMGMQAGGGEYPGKFTLLVHPTHADSMMGNSCVNTRGVKRYGFEEAPSAHTGSQEQFVLSNSIARPVYRVMLWHSNPFHFLTGWVEASISTGLPSQPHKLHGGEHPMWLLSAKTHLTASRESFTGSGLIDWFFDYWLPVFVHEVRYAMNFRDNVFLKKMSKEEAHTKAIKVADDHYQEVKSTDGISAAKAKIGLDNYHTTTLETYRKQGELDRKDKYQAFDDDIATLNDTSCGLKCADFCLNGRDLHEDNNATDEKGEPMEEQKKAN
jgi:hypothetical protein